MSGLEVIGSIASVAQLAATVYTISKTLYEVGNAISNAPSDIKDLAGDLERFSEELHLYARLLDKKHYDDQFHRLTATIIGECATICTKIDRVLRKLRSGSFLARVKWLYKEKEILKLLTRLRDLKFSLLSVLQLMKFLKADHDLDAIGGRNRSLLEGSKDEALSGETVAQVEATRKKLAGISVAQEDQSIKLTTVPAPMNSPHIKAFALPTNSMMQNSNASIQSFHSAVSHFGPDDDKAPTVLFQRMERGAELHINSSDNRDNNDEAGAPHLDLKADIVASAIKHFQMTREDAEAWATASITRIELQKSTSDASSSGVKRCNPPSLLGSQVSASSPPCPSNSFNMDVSEESFETGSFIWTCFCSVTMALLPGSSKDNPQTLTTLADLATLIARYTVMESMYHAWPGMTLEAAYEESILKLCMLVLQYLENVMQEQFSSAEEDLTSSYATRIAAADAACRGFTVTIVPEVVERDRGTKRRVDDLDHESGDSDGTPVECEGKEVFAVEVGRDAKRTTRGP